jgi:hypothetical protein
MTKNSIYNETGLMINPSTNSDRELLKYFFDNSDYYAVYDAEWNCFLIPNDEDTIYALEMELTELFLKVNISCRYEVNIL